MLQGVVEQGMPAVRVIADGAGGLVLQAHPGLAAAGFRLGQGLVGQHQQVGRGVAGVVRGQADIGHGGHVGGAGFVQALQGGFQLLGQLPGFVTHQAWREHREFTATAAGDQVVGFRVFGAGAHQLLADGLQQLVGALPAEALVEAAEVVDAQYQQVAGAGLFQVADAGAELHLEITPVGQARQAVLVGLHAQFLAAFGLLVEQCLELLHHLVHGLHHAAQFRGARQVGQAEEFTPGNGVGLLDHIVQRPELTPQQQGPEDRTRRPAQQQPAEAAQGALPEFGQGEHRVAHHLHARRLLPATADDGIAAGRREADHLHEPGRHAIGVGLGGAFHQHLVIAQVDHADAGVVATVKDRADHQFGHRRVIDVRRQRQRQRGGRVLGVGAQLVDVLGTRAFQADHEATAEGDHEKHTDSDQQLFEQ